MNSDLNKSVDAHDDGAARLLQNALDEDRRHDGDPEIPPPLPRDSRERMAIEDGVRVFLRDMAKTRLASRSEELDLAYRIVSLRTRFQAVLFRSRVAVLEALRWFGE